MSNTMIHGLFVVTAHEQDTSVIVSAFSECFQLLSVKGRRQVSRNGADYIKHTYSEEYSIGLLVGNNDSRSILCAYMDSHIECDDFARGYLCGDVRSSTDQYVMSSEDFLRCSICGPFLMVMIEGSRILTVTSYGDGDFEVAALEPGAYCIRYDDRIVLNCFSCHS